MRAVGYGYRALGLAPADGLTPTDADLAAFDGHQTNLLCDLAEYRILATCRNRWTEVRMQVGSGSAYWSDLRDSLDRRLAQLWQQLRAGGVVGLAPLVAGTLTLNTVETDASEILILDPPGGG
jgi:hypothetical protein